jgi:hypothetical protein
MAKGGSSSGTKIPQVSNHSLQLFFVALFLNQPEDLSAQQQLKSFHIEHFACMACKLPPFLDPHGLFLPGNSTHFPSIFLIANVKLNEALYKNKLL